MKKIVSVIQQKGGVGKTTLAVCLAHEVRRQRPDLRVAIADADPQQSAYKWIARGLRNGKNGVGAHAVATDCQGKSLRQELAQIDADVVIVDLPPAIESVALRAALYSQLMLVPIGASALDIEAGKAAIDICEEALSVDETKNFLIVPSKVRSNTAAGRELRSVIQKWGPVSKATLGLRQPFADAAAVGEGVSSFAARSAAHKEIQILANEVIDTLGVEHGKTKIAC